MAHLGSRPTNPNCSCRAISFTLTTTPSGGVVEVCKMLFPAIEVGLDLFNVVYELGVGG